MDKLVQDLRFALRMMARRPGFTAAAALSLALGIGANTTIFSIVNELFLKPLRVADPQRLVTLYTEDAKNPGRNPTSHLNWKDIREGSPVFSGVLGYDWAAMSVATGSEASLVVGQMVSGNYFQVLGIHAARGRTFLPEEDGAPGAHPVVVVSHRFWVEKLGADPKAVGRPLTVNGHPFTVVGVTPPGFTGTDVGVQPLLWIPMAMNKEIRPGSLNWYDTRRGLFVFTIARLAPGTGLSQAQADLDVLSRRLESAYPDDNKGRHFVLVPFTQATIFPGLRDGLRAATAMLMVVVGLVLLIACTNVANLLLARGAERRRETAVRLALGAGRRRLIAQLLTESVLLAALGGAAGIVVAYAARRAILAALPSLPFPVTLSLGLALDGRVLLFTGLLTLATGFLFGLVPAFQASRPQLVPALKDQADLAGGGGRRLTLRGSLVAGQVALCLLALVGAGLFLRSLSAAQRIDPGFESEDLLSVGFDVGLQGYDQPHGEAFFRDAVARVGALPGVVSAAVAQAAPLQGTLLRSVLLEGHEAENDRLLVQVNAVGPGYFRTVGTPIREGRPFAEADRAGSVPVVVVNQTMATRFWPGKSALGQRFRFFGGDSPVEVVGVAADAKYNTLGEDPQPYIYQPIAQAYMSGVTILARTALPPGKLLPTVEREIRRMDPSLPLVGVATVSDLLANSLWAAKMGAWMLAIFGLLALVLAAVGIYGVMAYAVERRSREIGIRMALGAERGRVLRLVLSQGMVVVGVGAAAGLALALASSRLLAGLLFVAPGDPLAFAATLSVLAVVALAANLLPARRATAVDPIRALRGE